MKNIAVAFALFFSVAGASFAAGNAGNTAATATARQLVSALQLNEAQYLKCRNLENAKMSEASAAQATLAGEQLTQALAQIEQKFEAGMQLVLTPAQQQAYAALKGAAPATTQAN